MTSSLNAPRAWPRIGAIGLRVGALALLFYGASFYTRDWRSIASDVGQPSQAQAAAPHPKAALPLAAPERSAPTAWVEPLTKPALSQATETVPSCLVAEHYWDRVRWAIEEFAWRFDQCTRPSRPRRS